MTELDYNLAASLIANAFFSTFPKRTDKSHPTLQNFNFATFFKTLQNTNAQRAKLRSIFHYFDWLEKDNNSKGSLRVFRQVSSLKRHYVCVFSFYSTLLYQCSQVFVKRTFRIKLLVRCWL